MKLEFYFDLMLQLNWLKCLLLAFFLPSRPRRPMSAYERTGKHLIALRFCSLTRNGHHAA